MRHKETSILRRARGIVSAVCVAAVGMHALAQSEGIAADDEWLDALLGVEDDDLALESEMLLADALALGSDDGQIETLADLSGWTVDSEFGLGVGWKENVLNSNQREVDSLYGQALFDVFAMRPGMGQRPDLIGLVFGDYRYYDSVPGLSAEHVFVAHGQAASQLWGESKGSVILEGAHSKQAFDASTDDFETDAVTISLWQPELKLALEKDYARIGSVKVLAGGSKAYYSEKSEDYDSMNYGLGWSRNLSDQSRLSTMWRRYVEDYDERRARLASGSLEDPPFLKIRKNRWDMEWVYFPGEGALRKSRSRVLFQMENDVVGDYYERDQWEIRQSLEWAWGAWGLEAVGSIGNIDYAARQAMLGLPEHRRDETLRFNAELSRQISENLRAFARYERIDKDSNSDLFAYAGNAAAVGIRLSRPSAR